jgi:hypothetical protein
MTIIEVQHLRKRYGDTIALRDVSLSVEERARRRSRSVRALPQCCLAVPGGAARTSPESEHGNARRGISQSSRGPQHGGQHH